MTITTNPLDALLAIRNGNYTARWNFDAAIHSTVNSSAGIGNAVEVSYSFLSSIPSYYSTRGFKAFNDIQMNATRSVLDHISQMTNITFTEASSGGEMSFAMDTQSGRNAAYAYNPSYGYSFNSNNIITEVYVTDTAGDVWLASNKSWTTEDFMPSKSGYATLLHEIGHALGLIHPFDGDYILESTLDNNVYTVMSYNEHPYSLFRTVTQTDPLSYQFSYEYIEPETLMPYDILTLQYLYGANTTYHAGSNVYTFDTKRPFIKTIWDTGGTDKISVKNFTLGCMIDLGEGHYSTISIPSDPLPSFSTEKNSGIYDGTSNLAIAYGTLIENAIGGHGNDELFGNALRNNLNGNSGNDTLNGGIGNDTLKGGAGSDIFVFDTLNGIDKIKDFKPTDDTIWLDRSIFTALPVGTLSESVFISGRGYSTAQDSDDHLIYNTSNGYLYYDPDGMGGDSAIQIATLTTKPSITLADIILI